MKKVWIALFVIGLAVRLIIAWLPVPVLITRTMPDDAFIYFVIARNIGTGLGATFDGVMPTNGFHPLWALAIAPIFRLFPTGDLPVHLVLTLSAICDAAAGVLIAWVVWRLGGKGGQLSAPTIAMALYLFNPRAIQESVNGLETGSAMLALAGCVAAWVWLAESPGSKGRSAFFGALAGLSVLARSDLGLIVAVLAVGFVFGNRKYWPSVILAGVVGLIVVAPWLAWSQLRVGTMVQSSGVAIPSLVSYRIQMGMDNPAELWGEVLFPIVNFSFRNSIIYPGAAMIAAIAGVLFVRWPAKRGEAVELRGSLWVPLIGALLIVVVHTFVRWYPRGWYFVPLAWSWAVAAGPLLAAGLAAPMGRRFGPGIGAVLALIVVAQSIKMIGEPEYKWQGDMRAGAEWLAQNVEATETVGAFNAGIYAYYSGQRVLSLDGLVDWGAIEARQEKRLLDYFVSRGGTLMIDHEAYAIGSFSPFFGSRTLELVAELPVAAKIYGPIVVYRVK
jgi:hypothetical protein